MEPPGPKTLEGPLPRRSEAGLRTLQPTALGDSEFPGFLYGTAWKEQETERLTRLALEAGFRGVDTANQRRHYFEAGVGAAVKKAIAGGVVRRDEVFLQTKFTYSGGQDQALDQLKELWAHAIVPPAFVQNRCFASLGWDRAVRAFGRAKGIVYQGFSLLTANGRELQHPAFLRLVARVGKTPAQVVFRFAHQVGMLPLTGTTDVEHMREDLEANRFELSEEDVRFVETIATVATPR